MGYSLINTIERKEHSRTNLEKIFTTKKILAQSTVCVGSFDKFGMVGQVDFNQVREGLQKGTLILIDVRNREELANNGAIPGAKNIPLPELLKIFSMNDDEFSKKLGFAKNSTNLTFSCQSGKRANDAVNKLKGTIPEANMKVYAGSFADWKAKGGQIVK